MTIQRGASPEFKPIISNILHGVNPKIDQQVHPVLDNILTVVLQVYDQNKEILTRLKKQPQSVFLPSNSLSTDFPVQLPIASFNDIETVEAYLANKEHLSKLALYLSSLGGKDITSITNNILRKLLSNELGCSFSFFGKRANKKGFADLHLKSSVIDAVKFNLPQSKEKDIEDVIKVWLKHSPQRLKMDQLKRYKKQLKFYSKKQ